MGYCTCTLLLGLRVTCFKIDCVCIRVCYYVIATLKFDQISLSDYGL